MEAESIGGERFPLNGNSAYNQVKLLTCAFVSRQQDFIYKLLFQHLDEGREKPPERGAVLGIKSICVNIEFGWIIGTN